VKRTVEDMGIPMYEELLLYEKVQIKML